MIYTITPNPTLDLSGTVKNLILNEKNYVDDELRIAGGNGVNAARVLSRLGTGVTITGFQGGSVGEEIKQLLKKEGLKNSFIKIKDNSRINLTVSNKKDFSQTRLSFPGPKILKTEFMQLEQRLKSLTKPSLLMFGGSLPRGVEAKDISQLIVMMNKRKHLCIVDMPGSILKVVWKSGIFLIKPNLKEFQEFTNTKVASIHSVALKARQLTKHIPLICISSVEGGAILVSKNCYWYSKTPTIKVRSTVGAGDSMLGAMASELERYKNKIIETKKNHFPLERCGENLLKIGIAAASATLIKPGITLCEKDDIYKFYSQVKTTKYFFQ